MSITLKTLINLFFFVYSLNAYSCIYIVKAKNQIDGRDFSDIFYQKGIPFFTHDTELYRIENILEKGKILPGIKISDEVEVGSNASTFVGTNSFATVFLSAFIKKRVFILNNFDRYDAISGKIPMKMIFSNRVVDYYDFSAHSGWSGGIVKKDMVHFRTTPEIDILNFAQFKKNLGKEPWFADKELTHDKEFTGNLISVIDDMLKEANNELMFHEIDLKFLEYIIVPSSVKTKVMNRLSGIKPWDGRSIGEIIVTPKEFIEIKKLN